MTADISDFAESQNVAVRNGLIIGTLILILTVVFAVFFASRLAKPIISTTNRLRSLAQGNLTDPVDVWYSKDELGVLSTSLEETVFSLRQYISLITYSLTQISEGNLIPTITANIASIGHFHSADVPGRFEPGTGEINYRNVFAAIDRTGYDRYVGVEAVPSKNSAEVWKDVVGLTK